MDVIKCLNGTSHEHSTVADIIMCIGTRNIFVTNVAPTGGNWVEEANKNPFPKAEQPSDRQLGYFESLGGDADHAKNHMSKSQVSAQIDRLLRLKKTTPSAIPGPIYNPFNGSAPSPTSPSAVPAPAQAVQPVSPAPVRKSMFEGPFLELLEKVPDGYFAVRAQEGDPITFMRLKRPYTGRYKDTIKVQTQHAETLELRWVRWPSGRISIYQASIEEKMLLLITSYREAARLYAKEIGKCARCNTALTDERSRFFGIGPDCEIHWPWMIGEVRQEVLDAGGVPKF